MNEIPVFYRDEIIVEMDGFSPSTSKPRDVVASWQKLNIPLSIQKFEPIIVEHLKLVHAYDYVDGVFAGTTRNGFGNKNVAIAESSLYTIGALFAGAKAAMLNKKVAVAPVSGFHHAGYGDGYGYCTFNGLLVTSLLLLMHKLAQRIGILDLDVHPGDGTASILSQAWYRESIVHHSMGYETKTEPEYADAYLAKLPDVIASMKNCDVILFQAGADPHIDDPLGGFLTTEQLRLRDHIVFRECAKWNIPVVWDLAGGYQRDENNGIAPILALHDNTLVECAEIYLRS
ncbi:hypothetical protein [Rheinheimera texasensis]|uniref:hypothetical protein n=1 Tax=Rheinheimera texasensis TaxID=306205 RepID=UPI0004E14B00|nr:hypothetical protein [Rheinheimera texasensis]